MARNDKTPSTSWRSIPQKNQRGKVSTKVSRRRKLVLLLRSSFVILVLLAVVTGVFALRYFHGLVEEEVPVVAGGATEVEFVSDGVLTRSWFNARFPQIERTDIRQLDVRVLKESLAAFGQVREASVTVVLPSLLKIELREREPMLRIRLRDSDGSARTLLVARDGTLYDGALYPQETLRGLPGVAGLRIRQNGDAYEPITGLEPVALLLDLAKQRLPALYSHWQVLDLSDWNPEVDYRPSLIRVSSSHIKEIVFSTTGLKEQMEQLSGILQHVERYQLGQPTLIDLSFGEEAVIRYN